MWPVSVVVVDVVNDEPLELSPIPDDGAIEQFAAQSADPTFRVRVRDRGPHRTLQDLHVVAAEDLIEGVDERLPRSRTNAPASANSSRWLWVPETLSWLVRLCFGTR
jgi:hypothetical protein